MSIFGHRRARRGVTAFRHRNYRLFFGGQLISLIGTWMQQVAQAWLVLEVSGGDPFWLGVVAAAQFLPVVVFGLFAGVLADTLPKRQTLMAVQVVMLVLAVVLAVLTATGVVEVWMIVVLAVLLGLANAVDMPVRQAFAVEMVGTADVGNAVSLNSAMFNGARVVGPAVAGLTIGAFGVATAFAINAASFLAVLIALGLMRDEELHRPRLVPRPRSMGEVRANLFEGLRFVRDTPVVLLAVVTVGLIATFGMNFTVLIPPLAAEVLHSDAAGFGFLMTASGIGSLAAAMYLVFGGRPRTVRITTGAILLGAASVVLAFSSTFAISMVLMVFVGFGGIAMAATGNVTIQLAVPDGLRGRVMSVYTTVFSASVPVGGIAMGALASVAGVQAAIGVGGALSLATGLGAFAWYRRIQATEAARPEAAEASDRLATELATATEANAPVPAVLPQSAVPNTSAAFNPPNPNEVLSTRR